MDENFYPQYFSIPQPIINYLCDNYISMEILYKCCKYFYLKHQLTIIDILRVFEPIDQEDLHRIFSKKIPMYSKSLDISKKEVDFINFRIWVTSKLHILAAATKLISKIVKCDIKQLIITCKITYSELKILAQSGTIQEYWFWPEHPLHHDDVIPLEDILELIPRAYSILISICKVTKNTTKNFLSLKHQTKLRVLVLEKINESIDVKLLDKFLKVNLDDKADFQLSFTNQQTNEFLIKKIIENMTSWIPEERKPKTFPNIQII